MEGWKKFWKLRRQDDRVKVMLMFFAAGVIFFTCAGYQSVRYYKMIQSPAEYVLTTENVRTNVRKELSEICKLDEIAAVGFQSERDITLKYQEYEGTFSCMELSKAYMEAVYGVKESSSMKTFYMNEKAYRQLCRESGLKERQTGRAGGNSLRLSYMDSASKADSADPVSASSVAAAARVMLVKQNMPKKEPYVFCKKGVQNEVETMLPVRIFARRQDWDGQLVKKLQESGFTLENQEEVRKEEYERGLLSCGLKYNLLAAVICFCSAAALRRFYVSWGRQQKMS